MKPSDPSAVSAMYDATAVSYAEMMDSEIDLPIYSELLGRLRDRISGSPGPLIDTSCGSGHMLALYHERYDPKRSLLGIDLSPTMVSIAGKRLGPKAEVALGDMRDLSMVETGTASAVLSFFALHHLDPGGVREALTEWYRVLGTGGQLVVAAWEGAGSIDYGDSSDIVALRYHSGELTEFAQSAGLAVTNCLVEPVEEIPMDAIYLEAMKA